MSENHDSSSKLNDGGDPPIKKARYLWKIRGSYQLNQEETNREAPSGAGELNCLEDHCLRRNITYIEWHTHQMAKALFDNTVNSMIENMGFPLLEIENIIDGFCNSGTLEDEAVRMAIRSHGLQKPCSCAQKRHNRPLPENIPFHQRINFNQEVGPSTSSLKSPLEDDILSEAVSIAIQKKGLGASQSSGL